MKKRILAILITVICLMSMSTSVVFADTDLDEETQPSGNMTVNGQVSENSPGTPSYIIRIPSTVDFGKLKKPAVNTDSMKVLNFDVTLVQKENIANGSGIAVLVSDSAHSTGTDAAPEVGFQIKKTTDPTNYALDYSVCIADSEGNIKTDLFQNGKWYPNGFLYGVFSNSAPDGSVLPGVLQINEKQLYDKDIANYKGDYSGIIHFYTGIRSTADLGD